MRTQCFGVFDKKGGVYATPFFCIREGAAIRSFQDIANNPETTVYRHPEDYELFHLGDFDDESGEFSPVRPRFVVNGVTVRSGPVVSQVVNPQIVDVSPTPNGEVR